MSKKSKYSEPHSQQSNKIDPNSTEQSRSEFMSSYSAVLLWRYLSHDDIEKLDKLSPTKAEKYMADLLDLTEYEIDLFQALILDFCLTQYWWASNEKEFNFEQISVYYSMAFTLFNNLKEKNMKIADNIDEFKNMLSDQNTLRYFNQEQIKDIIDHIYVTFLQNYKIFEYAFDNSQNDHIISKEIEVECPKPSEIPFPPPLDEAMPENLYKKFILKIEDEIIENETAKSENLQLSQEVIEQINNQFEGISIEEAKKIIYEVTNELVNGLKDDIKNKVKEREAALLSELTKEKTEAAHAPQAHHKQSVAKLGKR